MKRVALKSKLPGNIVQEDTSRGCIPTSLAIAMNYLDPNFLVTEKELLDLLGNNDPGFEPFQDILTRNNKFNKFLFKTHVRQPNFKDHAKIIRESIRENRPVLLSLPVESNYHIRVCYEWSEKGLKFRDPMISNGGVELTFKEIEKLLKSCSGGGDILVVGLKTEISER
jgi:hypothetical protein